MTKCTGMTSYENTGTWDEGILLRQPLLCSKSSEDASLSDRYPDSDTINSYTMDLVCMLLYCATNWPIWLYTV